MLLAIALLASMHAAPADSVGGKWQIKGDVVGHPVNSICDIRQTGTTLAGACVSGTDAPTPITGEVKGDSLSFQHGGTYEGQEITVIYSGKLEAPRQIKGTILVKPFDAVGTFTAEPAPVK